MRNLRGDLGCCISRSQRSDHVSRDPQSAFVCQVCFLSAVAYSGLSCKTGLDLGEITRLNKDFFYLFPELSTAYSLFIEISEVCGCKNLWQTAKLCKSNGTVYKENVMRKHRTEIWLVQTSSNILRYEHKWHPRILGVRMV